MADIVSGTFVATAQRQLYSPHLSLSQERRRRFAAGTLARTLIPRGHFQKYNTRVHRCDSSALFCNENGYAMRGIIIISALE